jgi:hypothetical protein
MNLSSFHTKGYNTMKSFNRIALMLTFVMVALVAAACGGGGGGSTGSAADAAKAFLEGTFKADAAALRNVTCEAQRGQITDEALAQMSAGLEAMGGAAGLDLSGVTYTYNEASKTVTLGGVIKATVSGVSMDVPVDQMFGNEGLPVIEEGGGWRVCPTGTLGG